MMVNPDVAGFQAAQARLRAELGVDVTFLVPVAPTYPPGTPVDPDTGRPLDPFAEPVTERGWDEEPARVSFINRGVGEGDAAQTPLGSIDEGKAALIIDGDTYGRVRRATRVKIGPETYAVEQMRYDPSLRSERYVVFLEHA